VSSQLILLYDPADVPREARAMLGDIVEPSVESKGFGFE